MEQDLTPKSPCIERALPSVLYLLGWYEIVCEDGFVLTVPLRYGVNIQ